MLGDAGLEALTLTAPARRRRSRRYLIRTFGSLNRSSAPSSVAAVSFGIKLGCWRSSTAAGLLWLNLPPAMPWSRK
jgi:hypothetical protein